VAADWCGGCGGWLGGEWRLREGRRGGGWGMRGGDGGWVGGEVGMAGGRVGGWWGGGELCGMGGCGNEIWKTGKFMRP
jgi:hypothetical protein